jgi:hypothetical protein
MGIPFELLIVIEVILISFGSLRIYQFVRSYKQVDQTLCFEDKVAAIIKSQIKSKILSTIVIREINMYYYLFAKYPLNNREKNRNYSYHEKIGYGGILGAFIFVLVAEGVGVSLLLHKWNQTIAIIHLILSVYMIIFMVADFKAIKRNPIQLEDEKLSIKFGLRMKAEIMLDNIEAIQSGKLNYDTEKSKKDVLDLSLLGLFEAPDFEIILAEPVMVKDFIGRETWIKKIFLSIDDKDRFYKQYNSFIADKQLTAVNGGFRWQ